MRIAHIAPVFPPYRGGMGAVAYHQARALAAAGAAVTVLTPKGSPPRLRPEGVELIELRPLLAHGNGACLPQVLWRAADFDVVHLHYPFFGTAELLAARQAARGRSRRGPRLVLQYQMDAIGVHWKARVFDWHRRTMLPFVLRTADAIIVTSTDYADSSFLARAGPPVAPRLVAIPGGVDLAAFSPAADRGAARRRLALSERPMVFFLARLDRAHYFKGLHVLIEALAQIPEADLVVGGDGEWRAQYEQQARHRLGARARFVGDVPDEELPSYYRAADVVAVPSIDRTEAFGLVVLEALACGTPVVASRLPGVRTLIDHGRTGYLVSPGDPIELAARLAECLRERPARAAQVDAFPRQRFGWPAIADELLALYRRVIAGEAVRA